MGGLGDCLFLVICEPSNEIKLQIQRNNDDLQA